MRKLRAGALLGGLTLVAVLLLAGLVRAQLIGPFSSQYLKTVKQVCGSLSGVASCLAVVDAVDKASGSDSIVDLAKPIAKTLLKFPKDTSVEDTCEVCLERATDFWNFLATNGTAADFEQFFADRCIDEFQDPADQNACVAATSDLPTLIDGIVRELPPVTLCQEAKFCPR